MNISQINNIIFGAKYITNAPVKKFNYIKAKFEPYNASFVQIEPSNRTDYSAIKEIVKNWEYGMFTREIFKTIQKLRDGELPDSLVKVYAVTKQRNNFEKLRDDDILAIGEITKKSDKDIELEYLQVNPDLIYDYEQKKFKHTGSAFLNILKGLNGIRSIVLNSVYSATEFYEQNGFKLIDSSKLKYYWKSKDKM